MSAPVVRLPKEQIRRLRGAAPRGIRPPAGAARIYTLPWPPSVNAYWMHGAHGRVILTPRARAYHGKVAHVVLATEKRFAVPWSGKLAVHIDAFPPDADAERLHDADNLLKALFDSLTRARVWEDDSQVKRFVLDIDHPPAPPGRVEISIEGKA
jgi:crossover junction endodeoxyribonuclease RusA